MLAFKKGNTLVPMLGAEALQKPPIVLCVTVEARELSRSVVANYRSVNGAWQCTTRTYLNGRIDERCPIGLHNCSLPGRPGRGVRLKTGAPEIMPDLAEAVGETVDIGRL